MGGGKINEFHRFGDHAARNDIGIQTKRGRVDCDIRTHKMVSLHLMDLSESVKSNEKENTGRNVLDLTNYAES